MPHHDDHHSTRPERSWGYWVAIIGFFAIMAYFLWTEHRAHIASVIPFLPYLLIFACPLLHIFMHRGHSHGHGHRSHDPDRDQEAWKE